MSSTPHRRIEIEGVETFYCEAGPPDAPTLLLLHGYPSSSFQYRHFMPRLAEDLRDRGLVVDLGFSGNIQRRMRRADRIGARAAVLLGDDELGRAAATVRDLDTGEQSEVALDALAARLKALG